MNKSSLLLTCFFLFIHLSTSLGQDYSSASLTGSLVDAEIEFPIIGANISVTVGDEVFVTTTDIDGYFRFDKLPISRVALKATYIGYESASITNILPTSGKEASLQITMRESINTLDEVMITAEESDLRAVNELISVSNTTLNVEEVVRYAGTMQDVARMAQNFAGVSGVSDARNDVIVRGNSPFAVSWRLEGSDIPSPNHWATLGTSGGPVSMINTNMLRTSDFLAGAFPAEYGNVLGAVFDLKLRNGNPSKYEFLGQIGFNGFEAGLEGPIKALGKRSSFVVNYRYTTLGLVNKLGVNFGTGFAVPEYQDLSFKVNVPTKKLGTISIWGMGGISDIAFEAEPEDDNFYTTGSENLYSGANTGVVGIKQSYFFNSKLSYTLALLASRTINETSREEIRNNDVSNIFEETFVSNNGQNKYSSNFTLNYKPNSKSRFKAGLSYEHFDLNVVDEIWTEEETWFSELDFVGRMDLLRTFVHWKYQINQRLSLNSGLHCQYLDFNGSSSLEPRLALNYQVTSNSEVGIGFGKHSQLQPLPIYFSKDPDASSEVNKANENLDFMRSNHFIASYKLNLKGGLSLKSEIYYQDLSSIATDPTDRDFSILNFGADFGFPNRAGLTNEGEGSNYGLEITLNKQLTKGFYFMATNSLFQSTYIGSEGRERNTYYNSNHVTNILIGKEFNLNKKLLFQANARFTYAGGRRYTAIDLPASIAADREIRKLDSPYEERLSNYIRPDLKIGIIYNSTGNYTHSFSVDFQNIINRENELLKSYVKSEQRIRTHRQRGFFPDVRYQILF